MNLYKYAQEQKLSISEIARSIDVTPSYMYTILSGKNKASPKILRALTRVYKGKITEKMLEPDSNICKCCGRPME